MTHTNDKAANANDSSVDIVIVDDDKLTLEIASWILKDSNASHKLFSDHQWAMHYLKTATPQILIVDYYMPEVNGLEFFAKLEHQSDLTDTRLYLCSAILPESADLSITEALEIGLLDKSVICGKKTLYALIDEHCQ